MVKTAYERAGALRLERTGKKAKEMRLHLANAIAALDKYVKAKEGKPFSAKEDAAASAYLRKAAGNISSFINLAGSLPVTSPAAGPGAVYAKAAPARRRWAERLKTAAKVALYIALAPVALLSGCGGEEIAPPPAPKTREPQPQLPIAKVKAGWISGKEKLYWWPGYMVKGGEIADVSLGFTDVYYLNKSYGSPESIPQQARDANKAPLKTALAFSGFFLEKSVFDAVVGNNVFLFPRPDWEAGGGYDQGLMGYRVADVSGKAIASCFEKCQTYDEVVMKPGGEKVLFHELLHDVWDSGMTAAQKKAFADRARLFFNAAGDTWQSEEVVGAIWNGYYHSGSVENPKYLGFKAALSGPELDNWASEQLAGSGLAATDVANIKKALAAYFQIRASITFGRTFGYSAAERDTFIVQEGFAYLGANYPVLDELYGASSGGNLKFIPGFMKQDYSGIIKADKLSHMAYLGYGHFLTEDSFKGFAPYIGSFVDWMKKKYPGLAAAAP